MVAVIFFAVSRLKKPNPPGHPNAKDAIFKDEFYKWLWKKAGGLSVGSAGGDADAEGAPITVIRNGKTYVNPHTNRDVQWPTFKSVAPLVGIPATAEAFVDLTYDQWEKIVDHIIFGNGFNFTDNPVLAAYIGSWYWGSGSISNTNITKIKDVLGNGATSEYKLRKLVDLRKLFFESLGYSEHTTNSWKDRAESFYDNFSKFA